MEKRSRNTLIIIIIIIINLGSDYIPIKSHSKKVNLRDIARNEEVDELGATNRTSKTVLSPGAAVTAIWHDGLLALTALLL